MTLKLFALIICSTTGIHNAIAQSSVYSPVVINKIPVEKFLFIKKWAYKWDVIKDNNGKFAKTTDSVLEPADTAHLYYTANCRTNVQGGYNLTYCEAIKNNGAVELKFTGGQPAYGNEYKVYVKNSKFYFDPDIVYMEIIEGATITYKTIKGKLVFNQKDYETAEMISGYVNVEFEEITSLPKRKQVIRRYYLRGYFKTPVKA